MKLEVKKAITEELHEAFSKSKVVILTDYKGLNVAAMSDLRRRLRQSGIHYRVVKNRLLERASEQTGVEAIHSHFKGPSAVAFSYDDPVAPAKILIDFAKEFQALEIKVGVLGGKALDFKAIKALADLPPREQLLSQVLGAMNAVPASFVRALANLPQKLLYALTAIKDKKEAA